MEPPPFTGGLEGTDCPVDSCRAGVCPRRFERETLPVSVCVSVPAGPGWAVGLPAFFAVGSIEEDSRCSCWAVLEPLCFRVEVVCAEEVSPVPAGPG